MENEQGQRYRTADEVAEYSTPFDGKCWWCGDTTLTGEHKFKRADLKGLFKSGTKVLWTDGTQVKHVQGPNSDLAKFRPNLCAECNNARSQDSDRAWDLFSQYVHSNWDSLADARRIYFRDVFPKPIGTHATELARYVLKHFGCKIAANDFAVPSDLLAYLNGDESSQSIQMAAFYSHERAARMRARNDDARSIQILSNGPHIATASRSRGTVVDHVTELSVGPVGFLVKWAANQQANTGFWHGRFLTLYNRDALPYPELHEPWPSLKLGT
ncbi:hypothetical protein [Prescottella equi]|uniref:hypothetical protein n=1 Tax=Rhodococcus hoagii TaxID=43767 RepID=UPI001F5B8860|nr:hypothetical protein [Prescottella equi]UNQ33891.1 hypothetical protein MPC39_17635 [Prescottella equi]